jgi:hypothetical protein
VTGLPARPLVAAVLGAMVLACRGGAADAAEPVGRTIDQGVQRMKIRIEVEGTSLTATLDDTEAARDFASLLPLTIMLEDHNATEKIANLPRKLSTTGAPSGSDPDVGDIAYYAPWGNLAVYYQDFGYSAGLVKLGKIDGGVEALRRKGNMRATIARIEP